MSDAGSRKRGALQRFARLCREHPYAAILVLGSAIAGAGVGAFLPIEDLSVARRVLGGAIAGAFFALFPLGLRLYE